MTPRLLRIFLSIVAALVSVAMIAQQPSASSTASSSTQELLPEGTVVEAEIAGSIDAKKVHPGDQFRARLWKDVSNGEKVLLSQKTMLIGHIVEARPRTKDHPESRLTIAFDKAVLKNGTEYPLHGVIEGVELSAVAAAAAHDSNAGLYRSVRNPGSTTDVAMPGGNLETESDQPPTFGPTGIFDPDLILKDDAAGILTVLNSNTKAEVKIKDHSTLKVRITHIGA